MQRSITRQIVLQLDEGEAALALAGGKGASLTRMAIAGLPVPPGFLLTTEAYRDIARRVVTARRSGVTDLVSRRRWRGARSFVARACIHTRDRPPLEEQPALF